MDPSSPINMAQTSYTSRLTHAMRSAKPVSTRPQTTDVFVQPALRYSTHVFVRCDSLQRPHGTTCEGPFKVLQCGPVYYIIDQNGTNDNVSIDGVKVEYVE